MTRIGQIMRRLKAHVAKAGWVGTLADAVRLVRAKPLSRSDDDYDKRHGTDTSGFIRLWRIQTSSPNAPDGVGYGTAREQHVRAVLDPLPRQGTFVDLGCGKGRILLIAAEMGFSHVVGVEFVPEWAAVAEANLRKVGLPASVISGDVTVYDFPEGPLVVYLYDPFNATVMAPIAAKLRNRPGELWVAYINPRFANLFDGWMERQLLTPRQSALFKEASVAIFHRAATS